MNVHSMQKTIARLVRDEDGANAAEYALIMALVAVAIISGATLLGGNINTRMENAATTIGS